MGHSGPSEWMGIWEEGKVAGLDLGWVNVDLSSPALHKFSPHWTFLLNFNQKHRKDCWL